MNIALLGYGKMGKAIEKIAIAQGHEIKLKVARDSSYSLKEIDVAIDFSVPEMATTHLRNCLEAGIPVVSGTTGWLEDYTQITDLCTSKNGSFLYASNFSIGVNLFFEINKKVAEIMAPIQGFEISMEEIHHTQKLDAPSGTAITLAEDIIAQGAHSSWKSVDATNESIENTNSIIPILSKRIGEVPGTHSVQYKSPIDTITLSHEAHSREGFAQGAVLAATWLVGKKGVFSMRDVLNIS